MPIKHYQQRVNEQIRVSPVRVISADKSQAGILPTSEALVMARGLSMDLVEVGPGQNPPVCRIMDYGRHRYKKEKREKCQKRQGRIKKLRLRNKTAQHDIALKIRQAERFLLRGVAVQISVFTKRRDSPSESRAVVQRVIDELVGVGRLVIAPIKQGPAHICEISPKS